MGEMLGAPLWHKKTDDQKRIMTAREALKNGADYVVIGRPILRSKDPTRVIEDIK